MQDTPNPSKLIELLQALLPENSPELEELKNVNIEDEARPKELIAPALKLYRKLLGDKPEPSEALEEFKETLLELVKDEAEYAPFYVNYPEIAPAAFEFWAEAESFEASNEYLRKTLYGMPYNALKLLFCYRNKEGVPLNDSEALRKDPAQLFGEKEYAALAKVVRPALVFRALHLIRAIKKTNVLGAGAAEAEPVVENGDVIDFELIDELISARFMKIYG